MSFASHLLEQMAPWQSPDHENYLAALALMFEEAEDFWSEEVDPDTGEVIRYSWEALFDPDYCMEVEQKRNVRMGKLADAPWVGMGPLDFLAELVGERIPKDLPPSERTAYVKNHPNWRRGSRMSIVRAAQRTLTGQKTVMVRERDTGSTDDHVGVVTLTSETPNNQRVIDDIRSVLPADIVLNFSNSASQTYSAVQSGKATWTAMASAYPTYADAQQSTVGYTTYTIANT